MSCTNIYNLKYFYFKHCDGHNHCSSVAAAFLSISKLYNFKIFRTAPQNTMIVRKSMSVYLRIFILISIILIIHLMRYLQKIKTIKY